MALATPEKTTATTVSPYILIFKALPYPFFLYTFYI